MVSMRSFRLALIKSRWPNGSILNAVMAATSIIRTGAVRRPHRVRIKFEPFWRSIPPALLLVGSTSCSDFYLNNEHKRISQVRCWKGTISLERLLFLEGYYKAFSLVGECCALCKECAYPDDCRFPQEKRPSVESFSIDVIGTLKNLGSTSTVAAKTCETYSYYGIILLE